MALGQGLAEPRRLEADRRDELQHALDRRQAFADLGHDVVLVADVPEKPLELHLPAFARRTALGMGAATEDLLVQLVDLEAGLLDDVGYAIDDRLNEGDEDAGRIGAGLADLGESRARNWRRAANSE